MTACSLGENPKHTRIHTKRISEVFIFIEWSVEKPLELVQIKNPVSRFT